MLKLYKLSMKTNSFRRDHFSIYFWLLAIYDGQDRKMYNEFQEPLSIL